MNGMKRVILPDQLMDDIGKVLREGALGYCTIEEFVSEAVREKLIREKGPAGNRQESGLR